VKRTRLENSCCPIARSLDVIGDWWSLLIVRDALRGVRRLANSRKTSALPKTCSPGG
jgi:DNA-binding HxlR family transcriptional regulator